MRWIPVNADLGTPTKGHWYCAGMQRSCEVEWIRSFANMDVVLNAKGLPTFVLVSNLGRMEIQSLDIPFIENQAKKFTEPKGKGKHSQDVCRIYVKTNDQGEVLIGRATHNLDRHYRHTGPWDDDEGSGYCNFTGKGGKDWQMQDPPNPNSKYYGRDVKQGGQGTGGWVKV